MSKPDYYQTLGVSKGVSDAELKKAYRKMAMKYHPDRNPDDKEAEKKFKEVNEAYDILKDAQKRAAYDQYGHAAFEHGSGGMGGGGFGGFGGAGHADFSDVFGDFFGDMFGGGAGHHAGPGGRERGSDLRYNLTVSLEDAFAGKEVKVSIPAAVACETCDGSGAKAGTKPETCGGCGGSGQVRMSQGFFSVARTCPTCNGRGNIIRQACQSCGGSGRTSKEKNISVKIPKGVDNGTRIRLAGEGEAGRFGGPAGDLYIFVQVKKHNIFERDHKDIYLKLPLNFVDAALGTSMEIPTVDGGKARLKIPESTQPRQQFRLKGKGMPELNGSTRGDMYVIVDVEIPRKINKEQKEILSKFKEASAGKTQNPEEEGFLDKVSKFWGNAS
jgi:molecular chaperone DnaJ